MSIQAPFFAEPGIAACLADDAHPRATFVKAVRERPMSMLSADTLRTIHLLASQCEDAIVEIGAYVGGATVTVLDATRERRNLFVTIEEPVEHPTHPDIPTRNTIADLNSNIASLGLCRDNHYIIPGCSFEGWAREEFACRLGANKIGLLIWDADACFDRDFIGLAPYMAEGCLLVIDDYEAGEAKSARVSIAVNDLMRRELIEQTAYLQWGTWFGHLLRKPDESVIAAYRADWRALADSGDVYYQRFMDYDATRAPFSFGERMAFWQSAIDQAKRQAARAHTVP